MRVLIVNSKPNLLAKLNPYSHLPEYEFYFISSDFEGLEFIQKRNIDVVVSSLGDNDTTYDDIEFMLNIKEIQPELPVIVVQSDKSIVKPENLIEAGAYACLNESTSAQEIIKYINMAGQHQHISANNFLNITN